MIGKLLLSFIALVLLPSSFAAGASPDLESLNFVQKIFESAVGAGLMDSFKMAALGIANNLKPLALSIAGTLSLVSCAWIAVIAISKRESVIDALIEPFIMVAITGFLLTSYATIINDVIWLGNSLMGATGTNVTNAAHDFYTSIVSKIFDVFVKIATSFSATSWFSAEGLSNLGGALLSVFLAFAMLVLAVQAIVELIAVLMVGPVAAGLAIALGPLFVASLASHWTRRWFDQWLNFLINGVLLTAIVVVVLVLLTSVITMRIASPQSSLVGEMVGLTLLMASLGKILSGVPAMADALLPGRTSAGAMSMGGKGVAAGSAVPANMAQTAGAAAVSGGKMAASAGADAAKVGINAALPNFRTASMGGAGLGKMGL